MNHNVITQINDFQTIIDAPITITGDRKRLDDETYENMWALSFDEQATKNITLEELTLFVNALIHKRKQQLLEQYPNCPATFYLWFDEMAGQLRFNVISGHVKPPFGCLTELANSAQDILKEFIMSHNNTNIPWEELEVTDNDSDEQEDTYILKVYVFYL